MWFGSSALGGDGGGGIGGAAAFWWPGAVNSAMLNGFTVLFVFSFFSLHEN